jgi:tetratricopeptide (TPR) repeat protein
LAIQTQSIDHCRAMLRRSIRLTVGAVVIAVLASSAYEAAAQQPEADVFVAQAILAYAEQRYDEALAQLQEALRLSPDNVDALYYTGLVRLAQKRPELAVEPLERARRRAPDSVPVLHQLGVAYFAQAQYDRAQPLLERVFSERPDTDSVGYYVGFLRYRRKDYTGALRAFRANVTSDPNVDQLTRLYSGLALAVLGLPERAAAEVEAAQRIQPTSPLTGPADRLREAMVAARERERRFGAEVRVGGLYDTNVPVLPGAGADPLVTALQGQEKESPGALTGLRLDYSFFREGPWEAIASYSLLQILYTESSLTDFDLLDQLASVSTLYRGELAGLPYQLGLQYSFNDTMLGWEDFLQRHTLSLFGTLIEGAHNLSGLQLRTQHKDFKNQGLRADDDDRDAWNYLIGLTHVFRFADDRHLIRLGYQFDFEDTSGRNFSYLGHRLLAGVQYTLPWRRFETVLRYDYDVHFRDYTHINTSQPTLAPGTRKRHDTEQTHVIRVEQNLAWGLLLAADYQIISVDSNFPVFSFDRNVVSLSLSWRY